MSGENNSSEENNQVIKLFGVTRSNNKSYTNS